MKFGSQVALATTLVAIFVIGLAVVASAHALYTSSVPAANSTVAAAPSTVKVLFDAGVNPKGSSLAVAGPGGAADQGDGHVDLSDPNRQTMLVTLKPNLSPGKYTVSWATVAADDGDAANGTWVFTVAAPAPAAHVATAPAKVTTAPAALPRAGGVSGVSVVVAAALLALAGTGMRRMTSRDGDDGQTG